VTIVDTSVNGVSVDARRRPPIGSPIHVGRRRGVIVRHSPRGFVVVYEAGQSETDAAEAPSKPVLRAV